MNMLTLLAAISGQDVLNFFFWLVIAALIYYVLTWGLSKIGLPEPFNKIVTVILVLVVVIVLINALLLLVGKPFITW